MLAIMVFCVLERIFFVIYKIRDFLKNHAKDWPVKIPVGDSPVPLIRFNKEANGVVGAEEIGIVTFWFNGEHPSPCVVTKIMDASLSLEFIRESSLNQQRINRKIGCSVFPLIYDAVLIDDRPVIFQEPIESSNFEKDLIEAISGAQGNLKLLKEVVARHLGEMGNLFKLLQQVDSDSDISLGWGDWAYSKGKELKENSGMNSMLISDNVLDWMRNELNHLPLRRSFVLADHNVANFFEGPVVVDQIDNTQLDRMRHEPCVLDGLLFLIAYFRTSPTNIVYKDWVPLLAGAVQDNSVSHEITKSIKGFFDNIGVGRYEPQQKWALVMLSFFMRAMDELTFHKSNIFLLDRLRSDLEAVVVQLIAIREEIVARKVFNVACVRDAEATFVPMSSSNSQSLMADLKPHLVEEGYNSFNIVSCKEQYYAIAQDLGPIDLAGLEAAVILENQAKKKILVATTLDGAKRLVNELFFTARIEDSAAVIKGVEACIVAKDSELVKIKGFWWFKLLFGIHKSLKKNKFVMFLVQVCNCHFKRDKR